MLSLSGHKTNVQEIMYLKENEKKRYINHHYIPHIYALPLTKMSYTNAPPKYMTTFIPKTTPLFFSRVTKGKSLRSSHLLISGRASIIILILITIIITGAIKIVLVL